MNHALRFQMHMWLFLLLALAQVVIIGLKLDGPFSDWAWLWVLSPMWGLGMLVSGMFMLVLAADATNG
jgi:hypothetical protein